MTMITVMQIGALTFMTLLPVALSVILYMTERQPWTKKFSYGVKQAIIGVLFGLVAVLATEAGIPVNGAVLNVRNAAPLTAGGASGIMRIPPSLFTRSRSMLIAMPMRTGPVPPP